ncbi:MAG: CinA family protein [Candidatus Midichloria sp.]|nr:CinA family protein [Candidatus Midichloria sp.]
MIIFSDTTFNTAKLIIQTAEQQRIKIAGAESCTGGLIAGVLTSVPGSSAVFEFGIVSYANHAKSSILKIPAEVIAKHGAVSSEVALTMAEGLNKIYSNNLVFTVTGIAGPGGGSAAKPVGTVFIGISNLESNKIDVVKQHFVGDRATIRMKTVDFVLQMILSQLS